MSFENGKLKAALIAVATVLVFAFAVAVLRHTLANLDWLHVAQSLRDLPPQAIVSSMLFAAFSYLALTVYDCLGTQAVGKPQPWRKVAPISFMSFGIAHSVGLASLSGGSIRYRFYTGLGLRSLEIAGIVTWVSISFALGVGALLGVSLLAVSEHAARVLHLPLGKAHILGGLLLSLLMFYLLACYLWRKPLHLRGNVLRLPAGRLALTQVGNACVDLTFAAASLFVLMPADLGVHFPAFLGVFVLAIAAGALSNVPGGLGVFEGVLISLLPDHDPAPLLGAVLLYRFIYYVLPFIAALTLLAGREAFSQRHFLRGLGATVRRWLEVIGPQALALAVFVAGSVLLLSGATPEVDSRMMWIEEIVPLGVLELSHIAGSAIGVALLILARGLYRRLDAAWWLTMALLFGGIVASLLKGFDYEEACFLGVLAMVLGASGGRFYRRAPLFERPFSLFWIVGVLAMVAAAVWVSIITFSDVPYEHDLWWQFAFDDTAPRVMRAGLISVLLAAAYALWMLLSPSRPPVAPASAEDFERAAEIVATARESLPNLVLLGDKLLLFSADRSAFIMYQRSGGSMITMGDPVGDPKRFPELLWSFRELCDRNARAPVFYQVSADYLPLYLDAGMALAKLGEDARVPLTHFSLEGPKRADLRNEYRRAARLGVRFVVLPPFQVAAVIDRLEEISDQWLLARSTAEKGFSVGRFQRDYVQRFHCACVMRGDTIVAFANLWQTIKREELSIDLMRYGDDAPKGVMDYLFIELMLWGKAEGYRYFNLGMAPFSGLERHPLAPFWHKLGSMIRRYGGNFYNFDGLRRYKEKFTPEWKPRYLASPGGLALPRVLLDAAALIAGGLREVVSK